LIVYYGIYATLLFLGKAARRGGIYWFVLFALFVVAGFRYEVGCDWSGYLVNWNLMRGQTLEDAASMREPAHWAMIAILQSFGMSYTYLLVIASAVFFFGLHMLARRQPNPLAMLVLAFPVLVINMPMSGIRQAEAIGVICLALLAFLDRKLILFMAFVGLASLFHRSAMIFLLLAPLLPMNLRRRNVIFAIMLALPGLYFMMQSSAADEAASRYINTGVDAAGSAFRLLILTLTGVVFFWKIAPLWRTQYPNDYKLVSIGAGLMVAAIALFFVSSVIGDRFGYYLIPIQLMIFARIPYLQGLRHRKLWSSVPYIALTFVFLVWTQLSSHFAQCYIPYQVGIYSDS
jgi:hypothetical protein